MYLVTHAQLRPGQQTAQVAHVVADFALERAHDFRLWHAESQYVVALQTPSPDELENLKVRAEEDGFSVICFREPDLKDQLTALAFVPCEEVASYLKALPLAGRDYKKNTDKKGILA